MPRSSVVVRAAGVLGRFAAGKARFHVARRRSGLARTAPLALPSATRRAAASSGVLVVWSSGSRRTGRARRFRLRRLRCVGHVFSSRRLTIRRPVRRVPARGQGLGRGACVGYSSRRLCLSVWSQCSQQPCGLTNLRPSHASSEAPQARQGGRTTGRGVSVAFTLWPRGRVGLSGAVEKIHRGLPNRRRSAAREGSISDSLGGQYLTHPRASGESLSDSLRAAVGAADTERRPDRDRQ